MRTNPVSQWMLLLFMLVLSARVLVGSYEPGITHVYQTRDVLYAKVGSLTSTGSLIPRSYYSLPYCIPPWGIKKSYQNLGEHLMGDQFLNSAYRFSTNMNESMYLCTTRPLAKHDVELLKEMIRDRYQVNIFLDHLPAARYLRHHDIVIQWTGFPVGYFSGYGDNCYIMNHLKFRVMVHKNEEYAYEIVGFEVSPCSVKHDPEKIAIARRYYSNDIFSVDCPSRYQKAQVIKEGERVSFTYEVEFVESDTEWSSRWDSYLKTTGGSQLHRFSIINSVILVLFLTGAVARIFIKTTRPGAYHAVGLSDKEAQQTKLSGEIVHSQLDVSSAFKGPGLNKLLCVMVGTGIQIMGTAVITVAFAAFGLMSPASRGALPVGIISLYPFLGFLGGFVGVYLWKIITGTSEDWRSISWYVASGFPGIVFAIHFALNLVLWHHNSMAAVPASVYLEILGLWLGVSVPLALLGGHLAGQTEQIKCPVRVEMVPRDSDARKFLVWLLALGAGLSPFATIFIELYFILSSLSLGRYYAFYGSLLIALLLLIITCVLVSAIVTYSSLRAEDSGWWWKAFWASGSAAIYVFLYCISYLIRDLRGLRGGSSVIIYIGYSIMMAILVMLAAGSVGFLGSFVLVKLLSPSKDMDCFAKIFNKLMPAPSE